MLGGKKAKQVVWFSEVGKDDIPLVGGKGANLGEMSKAGLPVPQGFIVTAEAYFRFIRAKKVDAYIEKWTKNLDPEDSKKLNKIADEIQKAMKEFQLPTDLIKEIEKAYDDMHQGGGRCSLIGDRRGSARCFVCRSAGDLFKHRRQNPVD